MEGRRRRRRRIEQEGKGEWREKKGIEIERKLRDTVEERANKER